MEQYPFKIAQIIQQNGLVSVNHGLLRGNTGLCIFLISVRVIQPNHGTRNL